MKQSSKITPEIFDNLLYLSRLSAKDSSTETIAAQVSSIVEYFDILKKFDTDSGNAGTDMQRDTVMRSDTVMQGIASSDLKKMTSEYMDGYFRVPKVLGSGV